MSPLILSDAAIRDLAQEYDVPSFARPKAQFLDEDRLDQVRRVFRVLLAMESVLEFQQKTGINVSLHFFRKRYPGVKLRILEERSYIQMMPSCLKYANNTYRFGVEYTDRRLVDRAILGVRKMLADRDLITSVTVDQVHFRQVRNRALRECFWYIRQCGVDIEDIDRAQLRLVLKNPRSEWLLSRLQRLQKESLAFVEGYEFDESEPAPRDNSPQRSALEGLRSDSFVRKPSKGGGIKHVSVGLLLFRSDTLLIIRKKQPPYAGKLSIVAGHLEEGESPRMAVQREAREELGLRLAELDLVKHYDELAGDGCRYGIHNHEWWIFISDEAPRDEALEVNIEEVAEASWVNVSQLSQLAPQLTFASAHLLRDLRLI